ncbi:carboxypeptidase-like regulatory domain-containing protein [Roseivirga sp.]|uniref:carboxypeptidase-like regulatory domain-containing protein n=1 Tax=Roseivirga sp. TaxID=1964215 RepID=UPI003B8C5FBF
MKIRFLFVLFSLAFMFFVCRKVTFGQTEVILKGRVIDAETGEGLPFATIAYPNKNLGIASNQDGYFQFYIPSADSSDAIELSFLGFKKRSIIISEFEQGKAYGLSVEAKNLASVNVVAKAKKFKVKSFMRRVIKDFNAKKNSDSHIAYAQYREMAFQGNEPIMYIESVGYSVYVKNKQWATYANYNFINEQTRAFADSPTWFAYGSNLGGVVNNGVQSSGGSVLRTYRVLETRGLLAENRFNKYRFKLDSSYTESNNEVLVIQFNSGNDKGKLFVNSDNYQIQKIVYSSNYIWSHPFHQNLGADILLGFNYINGVPYIKFGSVEYTKNGLNHITEFQTILQKDAQLSLNNNLFGLVNSYSINPIVIYSEDFWNQAAFPFDQSTCILCSKVDLEKLKPSFRNFTNRQLVSPSNRLTEKQLQDHQSILALIDQFK